ncbi:MAG TPA: A/G-specific adenine glycosylase [Chitinophagaceae bacterium]|nr:A/G-specific adenine glycosylase [Chitinophagaceae bacterium]
MSNFFAEGLIRWNRASNKRQMPWKGEKDPYKIWISEIILQQTRVEQGWAYYERFITSFPTVAHLAQAPDDQIFKHWEGLGYYTRCRNLIATARYIYNNGGVFPDNYKDIASLKGIGPYTAAAISSFAFNLPHAVVDGNVIRVLSRVFGMDTPVDDAASRKLFAMLADDLLDPEHPAEYNQAIMDFGATVCKPKSPDCTVCPFKDECQAFILNCIERLPNKQKKLVKKKRYFHYLIIDHNGKLYLKKRAGKDIWENLFEFCLYESDRLLEAEEFVKTSFFQEKLGDASYNMIHISPVIRQQLTHQELNGRFFRIKVKNKPRGLDDFIPVPEGELSKLAMPRFILSYLHEKV